LEVPRPKHWELLLPNPPLLQEDRNRFEQKHPTSTPRRVQTGFLSKRGSGSKGPHVDRCWRKIAFFVPCGDYITYQLKRQFLFKYKFIRSKIARICHRDDNLYYFLELIEREVNNKIWQ
jgi:hypothetical protein